MRLELHCSSRHFGLDITCIFWLLSVPQFFSVRCLDNYTSSFTLVISSIGGKLKLLKWQRLLLNGRIKIKTNIFMS